MPGSTGDPAIKLVFDVDADDLVERSLGAKAERERAARLEPARPAGHDARNQRVRLAADAGGGRVAGNPAQGGDLFGDGAAHARHGEIHARSELLACQAGGMDEESDGGARARMPVQDAFIDRQHRFFAVERLADDRGKEAGSGLVRAAGRTTMLGSLMPTPSRKPRRL